MLVFKHFFKYLFAGLVIGSSNNVIPNTFYVSKLL